MLPMVVFPLRYYLVKRPVEIKVPQLHVQYVCPPFVRYDGETVRSRWVNAANGCVSFEILSSKTSPNEVFHSSRIQSAYSEAREIMKEGKALPRWVEEVITVAAEKIGIPDDRMLCSTSYPA